MFITGVSGFSIFSALGASFLVNSQSDFCKYTSRSVATIVGCEESAEFGFGRFDLTYLDDSGHLWNSSVYMRAACSQTAAATANKTLPVAYIPSNPASVTIDSKILQKGVTAVQCRNVLDAGIAFAIVAGACAMVAFAACVAVFAMKERTTVRDEWTPEVKSAPGRPQDSFHSLENA